MLVWLAAFRLRLYDLSYNIRLTTVEQGSFARIWGEGALPGGGRELLPVFGGRQGYACRSCVV